MDSTLQIVILSLVLLTFYQIEYHKHSLLRFAFPLNSK